MGWIIEGIIEVIISIVADLIEFFLTAYANFDLDIGYNQGASWTEMFSPTYYQNASGLLDSVFPAAGAFLPIFMYTGYLIVFTVMATRIVFAMFGPLGKEKSVGLTVGRGVLAALGVTYSYTFFIIIERAGNHIYSLFKAAYSDITSVALPSITDYIKDPGSLIQGGWFGSKLVIAIIAIGLFITLLIQFLRLMLEMFERYVVLGFLFYTCPLAFATIGVGEDTEIFSRWLKMVFCQFVILFLNIFFIGVFYTGFIAVFAPADVSIAVGLMNIAGKIPGLEMLGHAVVDTGYVFESGTDFVIKMLILIAWLTVGQKTDEMLNSLGFSVARSGAGLGFAILAGMTGAKETLSSAARLVKGGIRSIDKAGEGMANARANDQKNAASEKRNYQRQMAAATPSAGKGRLSPGMSAEGYKEGLKRKDGTLTKEGAVNAVNAPLDAAGKPIMFSGKDASDILGHMGLNHDAPGNKLFKNDVTGAYSELKGASHEVGGGLITTKDQDGNIARQIGDANLFKVPGGGAAIMHNTPAGRMIEPMTQLHIDKAVENTAASLNNNVTLGKAAGITWSPNKNADGAYDGTLYGVNESGLACKAAYIDGVAVPDAAYGGTDYYVNKDGETVLRSAIPIDHSNLTYSIQNLEDPGCYHQNDTNGNFESILSAAKDGTLIPRTLDESNAYYAAGSQNPRNVLENILNKENAADVPVVKPYEKMPTRFGRALNKVQDRLQERGKKK